MTRSPSTEHRETVDVLSNDNFQEFIGSLARTLIQSVVDTIMEMVDMLIDFTGIERPQLISPCGRLCCNASMVHLLIPPNYAP